MAALPKLSPTSYALLGLLAVTLVFLVLTMVVVRVKQFADRNPGRA